MSAPPASNAAPLIEMHGVTIGALHDAETVVAADVNWTVASGDFWVIAGLQGAGKSDLLLTTAGLLPPRAGNCRLFGEPMPIFEEHRLATRLRLGLAFDGGQLLNHLTVAENIALPLRYHRNLSRDEVEQAVHTMLAATGLLAWASNTPGMLPRPWRKRAGLGRALMLKPEVLLVDGPLGGVDLRHAEWWLRFLAELARGHALFAGRPVTLVVTTDVFLPWRHHARQFALLAGQQLTLLGDWAAVERSTAPAIRLLREGRVPEATRADSRETEWTPAPGSAQ